MAGENIQWKNRLEEAQRQWEAEQSPYSTNSSSTTYSSPSTDSKSQLLYILKNYYPATLDSITKMCEQKESIKGDGTQQGIDEFLERVLGVLQARGVDPLELPQAAADNLNSMAQEVRSIDSDVSTAYKNNGINAAWSQHMRTSPSFSTNNYKNIAAYENMQKKEEKREEYQRKAEGMLVDPAMQDILNKSYAHQPLSPQEQKLLKEYEKYYKKGSSSRSSWKEDRETDENYDEFYKLCTEEGYFDKLIIERADAQYKQDIESDRNKILGNISTLKEGYNNCLSGNGFSSEAEQQQALNLLPVDSKDDSFL